MFGNPTPAHYISRAHDLPVLFVVNNNSGWASVHSETRAMVETARAIKKTLAPLHTDHSPFDAPLPTRDAKGVTFVEPVLVGEVRYSEWTPDNRLRQSSWRGLRNDKKPSEVVRE